MTRATDRHLAGIVLAGGQSSRMGENKADLVWRGQTLVAHAQASLRAAGCDPVLISGRPDLPNGFADSRKAAGPAHALLDSLDQVPNTVDGLLVVPVDMPLLRTEDLAPLTRHKPDRPCAWQTHPLPLYLPAAKVEISRDEVWSIRKLITDLGVNWLELDEKRLARLRNINTPEQFAALSKQE